MEMMMTNLQKAAILLEKIGEPYSTDVIRHLSATQGVKVIQEMAKGYDASDKEVEEIFSEIIKIKRSGLYGSKGEELRGE
jgi:flagellar motor switch protein FliG